MGDRFEMDIKCIYCGKVNYDIYYAPTSGFLDFTCTECGKSNFITSYLTVKKIKDVTRKDVYMAISDTANMMSKKQIERCARDYFNGLKKRNKKKWQKEILNSQCLKKLR